MVAPSGAGVTVDKAGGPLPGGPAWRAGRGPPRGGGDGAPSSPGSNAGSDGAVWRPGSSITTVHASWVGCSPRARSRPALWESLLRRPRCQSAAINHANSASTTDLSGNQKAVRLVVITHS